MTGAAVTLFLCGDVMTGRAVDQILPHPGDPDLREPGVHDARSYAEAAEALNGQIRRPVGFSWPWGSASRVLDDIAPDARVINLETSITRCADFAPEKVVHYRMNPANTPSVAAGRPDVCVLANNHVLDFGRTGLTDTFDALTRSGLRWVGAGRDAGEASRPLVVPIGAGRRVVIFAGGFRSSGIPSSWAATGDQPGVHFVPDLSESAAAELGARVRAVKRTGDVVVFSVHWGSNWGYDVSSEVGFAHRLIEAGVDVVHGHSSHHPRPIEFYRDGLILYGCGDLIDDYEGIPGYEEYRDDLRLLYFPSLEPETGRVVGLRMTLLRARRMRLELPSDEDTGWLRDVLARISRSFRTNVGLEPDGTLTASPL